MSTLLRDVIRIPERAAFCREELTNRAQQVGLNPAQLSAWRPTPTRHGRKPTRVSGVMP